MQEPRLDAVALLDFDGVLCDSLPECLVSSWVAYWGHLKGSLPDRVSLALHRTFYAIRPYIRSGEDYVLIQELIDAGAAIHCQEDFDAQLARKGPQTMQRYKDLFYRARAELLQTQRPYWIGLNRIYPFLLPDLRRWAASPGFVILSTKKASFILEILGANGVAIEPARVRHCDSQGKRRAIAQIARGLACRRVLWIEDQVDYLLARDEELAGLEVKGCLAAWGYVKPEWLHLGLEVLSPGDLAPRIEAWLGLPFAPGQRTPPGARP